MKDVNKALENYKPLILATYRRLHPMLSSNADKEELMSEIQSIFVKLVMEYDTRKGVDFPYYAKKMLELRSYHYVTKQLKVKKREIVSEEAGNTRAGGESSMNYSSDQNELERLINVLSWDSDFKMGKKQRNLFIGLMRDRKDIKTLAAEEGVSISTLHTRLHFLVKKLQQQQAIQAEREDRDENQDVFDLFSEDENDESN